LGDGATIVRGRCLSYGDHITYWPLKELVQNAIDVAESDRAETVKEKLGCFFSADNQGALATELLGQLLGVGVPGTSNEEIAWALSRFCQRLAFDRPAVVILDDMQWADPAMLELLQEVEARCRDVRLMFVCILRPDLDQQIPWLSSDSVGHSLLLEPLGVSDAQVLMENLLGGSIPERVRSRMIEAAEGNPLFIEELLGMLIEQGQLVRQDRHWELAGGLDRIDAPPTIRALLAARLDRLDSDERRVVDPAAVVGKVFQRQAVLELVDAALRIHVDSLLGQLVTKALVRPDPHSADGQLYRFRHLLIQDAAYNAMSKRRRGELHESFARWLETSLADRVNEYEEIIGYHLEQAYRYRAQLGAIHESGLVLARDSAAWLSRAARRSSALGATEAAARLLRRSSSLLPKYERARLPVLLDLAEALLQVGDLVEAAEVIADVEEEATAAGDTNAKARVAVLRLLRRFQDDPEGAAAQSKLDSEDLLQTFTECGDELALAKTWRLLAHTDVLNCHFGPAGENFQRAADHARAGGDRREECDNLSWLVVALVWGSTPAVDGLTSCTTVLNRAGSDRRLQTTALFGSAVLHAMSGHSAEARRLSHQGKELIDELGPSVFAEVTKGQACSYLEMYAGDAQAAEREALESYRFLERGGNRVWLSSLAGMLAQITYAQRRWAEAERYARIAADAADSSDVDAQVRWRGVKARLLARAGRLTDAEHMATEALRLAKTTDFLDMHADAFVVHAEVLTLQSRRAEAEAALDAARAFYERKGNVVSADQVRRLSTDLKLGAQQLRALVPLALV
jgi:predicted ATPase